MPKPPVQPPTPLQTHAACVEQVKAWQRLGEGHTNGWRRFVMERGSLSFDPNRHDTQTLSEFVGLAHGGLIEVETGKWVAGGWAMSGLMSNMFSMMRKKGTGHGGKGKDKGLVQETTCQDPPVPKPRLRTPPRGPRPPPLPLSEPLRPARSVRPTSADDDDARPTSHDDDESDDHWGEWTWAGRRVFD
jgi:hypothetical protein